MLVNRPLSVDDNISRFYSVGYMYGPCGRISCKPAENKSREDSSSILRHTCVCGDKLTVRAGTGVSFKNDVVMLGAVIAYAMRSIKYIGHCAAACPLENRDYFCLFSFKGIFGKRAKIYCHPKT